MYLELERYAAVLTHIQWKKASPVRRRLYSQHFAGDVERRPRITHTHTPWRCPYADASFQG